MMRYAKHVAMAAALASLVACGGLANDAGASSSAAKNFSTTVYYRQPDLSDRPLRQLEAGRLPDVGSRDHLSVGRDARAR